MVQKKVIIDTNFLLIPANFKVDIFEEIIKLVNPKPKLCIIDKTIDELEKIQEKARKGKDKQAAKIGIALIKKYKLSIIKTKEGHADTLILDSLNEGDIVATQDKELRDRAKSIGNQAILLRAKKYLVLK